jgi:hypothetical protein
VNSRANSIEQIHILGTHQIGHVSFDHQKIYSYSSGNKKKYSSYYCCEDDGIIEPHAKKNLQNKLKSEFFVEDVDGISD